MMVVVKAICDHIEDFQPISGFLSEEPRTTRLRVAVG